jgi:uncharacterized membrane protein
MGFSPLELEQLRRSMAQHVPAHQINTALYELSSIPTENSISSFSSARQINQKIHFEFVWLFNKYIIDITVGVGISNSLMLVSKINYLTKRMIDGKIQLDIWTGLPGPSVSYEANTEQTKQMLMNFHGALIRILANGAH